MRSTTKSTKAAASCGGHNFKTRAVMAKTFKEGNLAKVVRCKNNQPQELIDDYVIILKAVTPIRRTNSIATNYGQYYLVSGKGIGLDEWGFTEQELEMVMVD